MTAFTVGAHTSVDSLDLDFSDAYRKLNKFYLMVMCIDSLLDCAQ